MLDTRFVGALKNSVVYEMLFRCPTRATAGVRFLQMGKRSGRRCSNNTIRNPIPLRFPREYERRNTLHYFHDDTHARQKQQ